MALKEWTLDWRFRRIIWELFKWKALMVRKSNVKKWI